MKSFVPIALCVLMLSAVFSGCLEDEEEQLEIMLLTKIVEPDFELGCDAGGITTLKGMDNGDGEEILQLGKTTYDPAGNGVLEDGELITKPPSAIDFK